MEVDEIRVLAVPLVVVAVPRAEFAEFEPRLLQGPSQKARTAPMHAYDHGHPFTLLGRRFGFDGSPHVLRLMLLRAVRME